MSGILFPSLKSISAWRTIRHSTISLKNIEKKVFSSYHFFDKELLADLKLIKLLLSARLPLCFQRRYINYCYKKGKKKSKEPRKYLRNEKKLRIITIKKTAYYWIASIFSMSIQQRKVLVRVPARKGPTAASVVDVEYPDTCLKLWDAERTQIRLRTVRKSRLVASFFHVFNQEPYMSAQVQITMKRT